VVARLWIDGEIEAIGTGYSFFEGLWRQHSWGVRADGMLQETKWPYERYFGVILPSGRRRRGSSGRVGSNRTEIDHRDA
jgi:hypothetical protein